MLGAMEPPTWNDRAGRHNPFPLKPADLFRNTEIGFVFQDHCLLPQCRS
jgi:ABC-type lipoprotein export system ATPase subunit